MMKNYYYEESVIGIDIRNEMIDVTTATLSDFIKDNPEHKDEVNKDILYIKSHKMGRHEAVQEKIKSIVIAILTDIKKNIDVPESPKPSPVATADFMKEMRLQLQDIYKEKKQVTKDDAVNVMANMVKQSSAIDDKSIEMFKQLASHVLDESANKKHNRKRKK